MQLREWCRECLLGQAVLHSQEMKPKVSRVTCRSRILEKCHPLKVAHFVILSCLYLYAGTHDLG